MDLLVKAIDFWDTADPIDTTVQKSETEEDIQNEEMKKIKTSKSKDEKLLLKNNGGVL